MVTVAFSAQFLHLHRFCQVRHGLRGLCRALRRPDNRDWSEGWALSVRFEHWGAVLTLGWCGGLPWRGVKPGRGCCTLRWPT